MATLPAYLTRTRNGRSRSTYPRVTSRPSAAQPTACQEDSRLSNLGFGTLRHCHDPEKTAPAPGYPKVATSKNSFTTGMGKQISRIHTVERAAQLTVLPLNT